MADRFTRRLPEPQLGIQAAGGRPTEALRERFDEWVIRSGVDLYLAIERRLKPARASALCLSPAASGSK
jgi:hypothetical protein